MNDLSVNIRVGYPDFTLELAHRFSGHGITALFGPSGCGKSTLLRAISGFERGASGHVVFGNEVWLGKRICKPPHRRGVGFVFQDTRLFPHLNVRDNLDYAHKRAGKKMACYSYSDVVDVLDLAPLLDRPTGQLSGGERQRVAIGRTLLSRPRLLLMDEPLAALDTKRKTDILSYIRRLPEVFDIPILYVTHAVEEVTQLSDRIVALSEGRILAAGGVSETLERLDLGAAQGQFEAGVVLEGRIAAMNPDMHLTKVDLGGAIIEVPQLLRGEGDQVRLRVRARDVSLARVRPEGLSIRNALDVKVLSVVLEADTAYAEVLLDLAGQHLRARITRAAVRDLGINVGQALVALIKSASFDRQAIPGAAKKKLSDPFAVSSLREPPLTDSKRS